MADEGAGKRRKPNVIVFQTDQQRADSLGCMGNAQARTPVIDSLAARGVLYANHIAANPVCMPSRASLFTGQHVLTHRLLDNGICLDEGAVTLPGVLRDNGYHTESIGKIHLTPFKNFEGSECKENWDRWLSGELGGWEGPYYGFEKVQLTIAHGENTHGHYGLWREENFPGLKLGPENALPGPKWPEFNCWKSNLPLEAHYSTWIADRAVEFLDGAGEKPFFLHVSFPDPHAPFTPPAPYSGMFDGVKFAAPHRVEGENDTKPRPYRDAMTRDAFPTDGGARYYTGFEGEAYQQVQAHTAGMIALIDDSVGRIVKRLEEKGLEEDTIIVYTADHGDFLGDHWFLYKAQTPCRSLLNVPMILSAPGGVQGRVEAPTGTVDVMGTILSMCGVDVPEGVQGAVLPGPHEKVRRDYAFEAGWSKASREYHHFTIYKDRHRISVFPHLGDGELYDLEADPHEHKNVYHDPGYRVIRNQLTEELLQAVGMAEPTMPPVVTDW